jgi:hypothetical protein
VLHCWTKPEVDCKPLEKFILVLTEGKMFSMTKLRGRGVGWYKPLQESLVRRKEYVTRREMMVPKKAILASQHDESESERLLASNCGS